MTKHITRTGYYAGLTYCGAERDGSRTDGAHFTPHHLKDTPLRAMTCPACLKVLEDSIKEE